MTEAIENLDEVVEELSKLKASRATLYENLMDRNAEKDGWDQDTTDKYMRDTATVSLYDSQIADLSKSVADNIPDMNGITFAKKREGLKTFMADNWGGVHNKMGSEFAKAHATDDSEMPRFRISADVSTSSSGSSNVNVALPVTTLFGYVERLLLYGGVPQVSSSFRTDTGNDIKITQSDNTSQKGSIVAEGVNATSLDPNSFTTTTIKAHEYSSGYIVASRKSLQDPNVAMEAYLMSALVDRIGRIYADHYANGDNSSKPQGIVGIAKDGISAASATAFTSNELLFMQEQVYDYIQGPSAASNLVAPGFTLGSVGYLMSPNAWFKLRGLLDSDGRPLWQPSIVAGAPGMVHDYPIYICHEMDSVTTGKFPVLFGNFQNYIIRTVNELELFRFFDSQTAIKDSVVFQGFARMDARAIGPFVSSKLDSVCKLTMA